MYSCELRAPNGRLSAAIAPFHSTLNPSRDDARGGEDQLEQMFQLCPGAWPHAKFVERERFGSAPADGLTSHTPNRELPILVPQQWRDAPANLAERLGETARIHLWHQLAVGAATLAAIFAFFLMLHDLQFGTGATVEQAPQFITVEIVNLAPPEPVAASSPPDAQPATAADEPQDEEADASPVEDPAPEVPAAEAPPPESAVAEQRTESPKSIPKPRIVPKATPRKTVEPVRKPRTVVARLPASTRRKATRVGRGGAESARSGQRASAPSRASSRGITSPQAVQHYLGQVRSAVMRRVPRGLSGRFTVSLVIGPGGRLLGLSVSGSGSAADKARISGALRGGYPAPPQGVPTPFRVGVPVSFVSGGG